MLFFTSIIMWYDFIFLTSPPASDVFISFISAARVSSLRRCRSCMKISPRTLASSQARWWWNLSSLRYFATVSSLQFFIPLSMERHIGTVSMYVLLNSMPLRSAAMRIKEVSKSALCATSTAFSPQNLKKACSASFSFGAFFTISSVMLVSSVILLGICFSGSTNVSNESVISPFFMRTAPISVIRSEVGLSPVVSMSNDMNSPLKSRFSLPFTAGTESLTKYASMP